MPGTHTIALAARVVAATLWAMALSVTGLWAALSASREWPLFGPLWLVGGIAGFAAGAFVFMVLVADRLFPRASRRLVGAAELCAVSVFLLGLFGAVWFLQSGVWT